MPYSNSCPRCGCGLNVLVDEYRQSFWIYNEGSDLFDTRVERITSQPRCSKCYFLLAADLLAKVGLKHIFFGESEALGTNFKKVYQHSPEIYHKFSLAEDRDNKILNRIIKYCNPKSTKLLDIGSGTGKYPNQLSNYCETIFAVEPSSKFVNFAIQQSKRLNNKNIIHLLGRGEALPLPDNSIDVIIVTWAAFPINETFKEMLRVLKKNGTIIRVGGSRRDDLTSLFPKPNYDILIANNNWFNKHGFLTTYIPISIEFPSIEVARHVLGGIGLNLKSLKSRKLKHIIAFQTYTKK